ncbi:molybdopterin cofactor-binding domain-containing protein [Inquilinus sp. YAF38]|uniref:molybdopterin cofactor-binding domain-containing protein n=1 Tax=Inquilinus sp. YAF38 TaxID=3233084 RepID=UPI003F8E0C84
MIASALPKSIQDNPVLGRWLSLARRGHVTVCTGKVELGQGIATALAQIAADELDIGLERIEILSGDTDRSPDEGITAGSRSVEVSGASIRLASAQARAALLQAAATRLGADLNALSCRDGIIFLDGTATELDFWSLSPDVDWQQRITGDAVVKPVRDYRLVGSSPPRMDFPARLLRGGFIHDMSLEGMMHARVVRQPFRLAHLETVDEAWLRQRYPDVGMLRKNDFLALVGDDEYVVHRAHAEADAFVHWREIPGLWQPAESNGETVAVLRVAERPQISGCATFAARYSRPHLAHASIGPSCALAHHAAGRLTIWTHSQGVFALRRQIATCGLGVDPSSIRVIHVPGSGCYGHNGADDAALDAAIIAMSFEGRPVRVQWSREDELSRGPLGAAMSSEIEAELDSSGHVATWRFSVVSVPHAQRPGSGGYVNLSSAEALDSGRLPKRVDDLPDAVGGGASRNAAALYDFPRHEVRVRLDTQSSIRTSSLRSLGAHLNVFAIESAMDELAELAGADPIQFRLRHLTDERCRAVLNGVAKMSAWPGRQSAGRALGIAAARYKNRGAWLAAAAEVAVDEDVRVERLWLCVDAGLLVNPEGARNQIEGGAIQAISWTLKEEVRIDNDRVPSLDWLSYPILKFSEVPSIETRFMVDSAHPSLGTGEAAQGPVAAAIGNAASRALGIRVRDLPLTRDRLVSVLMQG